MIVYTNKNCLLLYIRGRERESVCVCEREREYVCVCERERVCVCERERKKKLERKL